MNFLSLFVLIPLVMLLGLWLARDVKGVRAVMVTGSSLLLILAGYLTVTFLATVLLELLTNALHCFVQLVRAAPHQIFGWCRWHFGGYVVAVVGYRLYRYICLMAT